MSRLPCLPPLTRRNAPRLQIPSRRNKTGLDEDGSDSDAEPNGGGAANGSAAARDRAAEAGGGDLLTESIRPRAGLPPLLVNLADRCAPARVPFSLLCLQRCVRVCALNPKSRPEPHSALPICLTPLFPLLPPRHRRPPPPSPKQPPRAPALPRRLLRPHAAALQLLVARRLPAAVPAAVRERDHRGAHRRDAAAARAPRRRRHGVARAVCRRLQGALI